MTKKSKASRKAKQQNQEQQSQQQPQNQPAPLAAPELSAFSLAAAIQEAKSSPRPTKSSPRPTTPPKSEPRKIFNIPSYQSLNTEHSFKTATDSIRNESTAASYLDDPSDDDNNNEDLNFGNDPLTVISRSAEATNSAPTEIVFSKNPEVTTPITSPDTMASKQMSETKPVEVTTASSATPATAKPVEASPEDEPHFDVALQVYAQVKGIWGWGKTVPIVQNFLGIYEAIATKVLDTALHTDLPALDKDVAEPNLKRLDDALFTPIIVAVWKILGPALAKSDEMVMKPVMQEIVPRILGPLGMNKKEEEKKEIKKIELKLKEQNPEYTSSAPELN